MAADDNMMRIGKRCYVSNLAWRTSWQGGFRCKIELRASWLTSSLYLIELWASIGGQHHSNY